MTDTYDGERDVKELASESMLRTIALYKAAGWTEKNLEVAPGTFWNSVSAATPNKPVEETSTPMVVTGLISMVKNKTIGAGRGIEQAYSSGLMDGAKVQQERNRKAFSLLGLTDAALYEGS